MSPPPEKTKPSKRSARCSTSASAMSMLSSTPVPPEAYTASM